VACVGVLVSWRRLGWSIDGTFWALPLLALSMPLARAIAVSTFVVGYNGQRLSLMNFGTVLFLYAGGSVLLFGGPRLLRASIVPLCLLLLIDPVPHVFNLAVDLPLQHLSASAARAFAHLIGLQPTGAQLRMMFAPDFGMFIAPGCNGVRGSITLGYLALIFGYARRLRPRWLLLIALAAVLLGYAFNFLRLCLLVVYYRIGLNFPSIQRHGAGIDYAIGCTLFLFAAIGLGLLIRSLEPAAVREIEGPNQRPAMERFAYPRGVRRQGYAEAARALCFLALTLVFIVPELRSAAWRPGPRPNEQEVLGSFPLMVGPYRLTRTWAEHYDNGMIALAMAEYSAPPNTGDTAKTFTFGFWVISASHLVSSSKFIQGIAAQWNGSFDATARRAMPVRFVTSFYDDGISRVYDAESTCSRNACTGRFTVGEHKGFFFAGPGFSDLNLMLRDKSLPILLRREWLDSEPMASDDLRAQFENDARLFIAQTDLRPLVVQFASQR
jgi:exosortase J